MWELKMQSGEFGLETFRYPSLSDAVKGFANIQEKIVEQRRKKEKFGKIDRWFSIEQKGGK